MSQLTVKIPKLDGVSPKELKKTIDYLILQHHGSLMSPITTRVVVKDNTPFKESRSKEYEIVSQTITKKPTAAQPDEDEFPSYVSERVSVDYPEQTVVEVELEGLGQEKSDIVALVSKEVEEYLSIYKIEVVGSYLQEDSVKSGAESGLELCVKIPQVADAYLQELKDDIEQIVKVDNVSSQAAQNGERARSHEIEHSLTISDVPGDPASQMVRVTLHGEVEKTHYEILWDVQHKLKRAFRDEVDSIQMLQNEILTMITICFPPRLYQYAQKQNNYNSLKVALLLDLKNEGTGNFNLILKKCADSTPPEVDAVAYLNIDCNDSHVEPICQIIKRAITTWIPTRTIPKVTCQPCCRVEHTQDVSQGKISYALTYTNDNKPSEVSILCHQSKAKLMMDVTYPEKLTTDLQTTNTWSGKFQEGIQEVLSKIDFGLVRRKLHHVDQHDGAAENGRDLESITEDHETAQVKEGYKRVHVVCINTTSSKDEIAQTILHQIKQMSG